RFFVLARGSWTFGGCAHPPTFGAHALLHAHTSAPALGPRPGGATCLAVAASHFHTSVYECPELLPGCLQPAADRGGAAPRRSADSAALLWRRYARRWGWPAIWGPPSCMAGRFVSACGCTLAKAASAARPWRRMMRSTRCLQDVRLNRRFPPQSHGS